jgi:hypothetical protein
VTPGLRLQINIEGRGYAPDQGLAGFENLDAVTVQRDEPVRRELAQRRSRIGEHVRRRTVGNEQFVQVNVEIAHDAFDDSAPEPVAFDEGQTARDRQLPRPSAA